MIFVIKRKTVIFSVIALMAVSIFGIGLYEMAALPSSAVPVSNKVIIIDAGHGGADGGAVGADGTVEKDLNLKVALKVQRMLETAGCTVFMTRSDDSSLSTVEDEINKMRKVADLNNRKQMVEDLQVEAFVSIHMNTFTDPQYSGTQVFYSTSPADSKILADYIQGEVKNYDPENERVAKDGSKGIFILNETSVPSVVVECGFLSNAAELERLKTDEYQEQIAAAVCNGIIKFYNR